jgi:hypothetical protein
MLVPTGVGHVHPVISLAFCNTRQAVEFAGTLASLPCDFLVKTTGRSDLYESTLRGFPVLDVGRKQRLNTLALNCLTTHYADLWSECWDDAFQQQRWAKDDPRLPNSFFRNLTPSWQRD